MMAHAAAARYPLTGLSMDKPAGALTKPFRRCSLASSPGWRELGVLLLGFVLTVACFMGATLYADSRIAIIAAQSHDVSDNAMPSILELGVMRGALTQVEFDLDEGVLGDREGMRALSSHVAALEDAWSRYMDLPRFQGEAALQDVARARLNVIRRVVDRVQATIEVGAIRQADQWAETELEPAARDADEALSTLIRFNHDQGKRTALEADLTWSRLRRLSIVADVLCALISGTVAWLGFRSTRRFMSMQKQRADELEAFASRVAHDVRGPLMPALFTLQMFERDFATDEKRRPSIERGIRSLKRVDQLVGDLLTFARAAAEPDGDAHAPLGSVIAGVVQDLERQAQVAGVRVDVSDVPACDVACAPGVLASVVMNLVSNAIKYMPADAAERVVRVQAAVDGGHVRVDVADTGAGLPESMHEQIFEPYVRVDRRQPGLGLGLATVRRLVVAHRGQVGVRSHEGAGALFWFAMPLFRAAPREEDRVAKRARLPAA
jgi:signal transduction histidine kinase